VVSDVGSRVTRFKKGDAVYARVDKNRIGTFAEFAVVRDGAAALKPTNVTFEEAASLPLVALTAWQALVEIGRLGANQRVLIHAGSGGVGSVAIQLARHLGATVFTTVGKRNVELVKRLARTSPSTIAANVLKTWPQIVTWCWTARAVTH
jgi:alcohol dehydrogenase